ncbi:Spy/CpxP family protein refolding chaperone [Shewanella profunda]|uniref:Spy/CpxP family protein refolding chaperone n=1 Tax=Shewanella profunda TaxID=254793 RepID=UPI00200F1928|nr:Spy/CpxP family protein refolding chaperone [Shewanella profunda]MCL1089858.1 Spy/CpxP family protein refolding chaperone [Shewanella profunda]
MMKTLSPLKAGLFAILASSVVFATTVSAEPTQGSDYPRGEFHKKGGRMEYGGMHKMFEGLDLTDAQKVDIKKIFAEQKASRSDELPTKEELLAHRNQMLAVITAATFDETQANALLNEQQDKRQAQAIERMKIQNQIYNLLTPEQQAKFKARFEAQAEKEPRG